MGGHDNYGKDLLSRMLGSRFDRWASSRDMKIAGIEIRLDGVIASAESGEIEWAIEIEAENEPQVRGAVLNLFLHSAPKAFLLLMPRNLNNPLPIHLFKHLLFHPLSSQPVVRYYSKVFVSIFGSVLTRTWLTVAVDLLRFVDR